MVHRLAIGVLYIAVFIGTGESTTAAPCGGTLVATNDVQNLTSPSYPTPSTQSEACSWTILTGDTISFVRLDLVDLDIEPGDGCTVDSVKVYDGSDSTGQLLATWCGQMSRALIYSTGQTLTVVYTVNNANNGRGLSLKYYREIETKNECRLGFIAKDTYSYLTSPRYPETYPSNLDCLYYIIAKSEQVKVEFLNTDLPPEVDGKCTSDYVTVFDGNRKDIELKSINTRKSRTCGSDLPVYISTGIQILVGFKSNTSATRKGFRLKYIQGNFSDEYIPPCGGDLTATDVAQTLTSPHYPDAYPRDLNCKWTIRAKDRTKNVRLTGNSVNITSLYSLICLHDSLNIYDGIDTTAKISTLCGFHPRVTEQTFSDAMTIVFTTGPFSKSPGTGFSLQYIQTNEPPECDFKFKGEDYITFYSTTPGYPRQYRTNHRCIWTIEKTRGSSIMVEFVDTNISNSVNCSTDYINVYDGTSTQSPQIGRFCGTDTPTFRSQGNITIEFVSGPNVNGYGFKFEFKNSLLDVCDITKKQATRDEQYITSTNYPSLYPRNSNCEWRLTCDSSSIIVLEVVMSDIEESEGCTNDRVEVYDGYYNNAPPLGKWCGSNRTTYRGTRSDLFIVLHSNDNEVTGRGFRLKYYSEEKPGAASPNFGAIVGGVVGGLAAIALISVIAFVIIAKPFCRNK